MGKRHVKICEGRGWWASPGTAPMSMSGNEKEAMPRIAENAPGPIGFYFRGSDGIDEHEESHADIHHSKTEVLSLGEAPWKHRKVHCQNADARQEQSVCPAAMFPIVFMWLAMSTYFKCLLGFDTGFGHRFILRNGCWKLAKIKHVHVEHTECKCTAYQM